MNWRSFCLTVATAILVSGPAPAQENRPPQTQPSTSGGSVTVIASVEAYWSADLYAKTAGYVSEVKHDIGDRVSKGDVLAVLHVPELEKNLVQAQAGLKARQQMRKAADAAVAQAQQALAVARSQLEAYKADQYLAQVTLKRQEELSAGKAATPQQIDDARAKAQIAQAMVGMGEAKLSSAQADIAAAEANRDVAAAQVDVAAAQVQEVEALLEYTKIIAPFDGIITRRQVNPGDLVQAATATRTSLLFVMQRLDTVRVFCEVPEFQAPSVSVGADADVKLYALSGRVIHDKVARLSTAFNPSSRTMLAEIDLPNPSGALRPGMYAQVAIKLQSPTGSGQADSNPR